MIAAALLGGTASVALAAPTTYSLFTTIAVPTAAGNPNPGGAFTAFDISFFDPTTGLDYVADRSNAGVDIYSGSTFSLVGRAPGFTGQQATTSVSGPDGVLVVGSTHTLFAGDGNSTLKTFDVTNPATPTVKFPALSTAGTFRVDEMAYSPTTNLVLVANNADAPAFGTLVNASTGLAVHTHITIPGAAATDGLEQPVWNPKTGTFFISVPAFGGGTDPGGVAEIGTDGTVKRLYKFASFGIASCSPSGLALGASGNLMVGCGNGGTQTVLLDPTGTGTIVKTFAGISGSDEIWYDPKTKNFFVTGVDSTNGQAFDVISDTSDTILQSVALPSVNAHSISVDPLNGDVFVPLPGTTAGGTDPICPLGCIAVFAQATEQVVAEPGTLPILATALLGVTGLALRRRRDMRGS